MTDRSKPDFMLIAIVLILVFLGMIMIYSASAILADFKMKKDSSFFLIRQLSWLIVSSAGLFLLMKTDYHRLKKISYVCLFLSAIFLVLVLFLDPTKAVKDTLQGGYELKQAVLSMGNGGLTGVGLGQGRQKLFFLPEPHTDFILATIGEEG